MHLEYPMHVGRLLPLPLSLLNVQPGLLGDLRFRCTVMSQVRTYDGEGQ